MAGLQSRFALLENSRFRLLFLATAASSLGNWLAVIALQVDVYDRTHSAWWVGSGSGQVRTLSLYPRSSGFGKNEFGLYPVDYRHSSRSRNA